MKRRNWESLLAGEWLANFTQSSEFKDLSRLYNRMSGVLSSYVETMPQAFRPAISQ